MYTMKHSDKALVGTRSSISIAAILFFWHNWAIEAASSLDSLFVLLFLLVLTKEHEDNLN